MKNTLGKENTINWLYPLLDGNGFIYDNESIGSYDINTPINIDSSDDTRMLTLWVSGDAITGQDEEVILTIKDFAEAIVDGDTLYIDEIDFSIVKTIPLEDLLRKSA